MVTGQYINKRRGSTFVFKTREHLRLVVQHMSIYILFYRKLSHNIFSRKNIPPMVKYYFFYISPYVGLVAKLSYRFMKKLNLLKWFGPMRAEFNVHLIWVSHASNELWPGC